MVAPEQWGSAIQQAVAEAQLPGAWAAINAGKTMSFGPVALSATEVTARGRSVPWSQIQEIKLDGGFVSLKVAGRWLALASTPVSAIPNFYVFDELAARLRAAAG